MDADKIHSLDCQVDGFIQDSPASSSLLTTKSDQDCKTLDKQLLQSFHTEAISFLEKSYSADNTVVLKEEFDGAPCLMSGDDHSQRRIEMDKLRLKRFHAQAVSFLGRAYADEPGTIVEEEAVLSPASAPDREVLTSFHVEAMKYLDAAAAGKSVNGLACCGNVETGRADRTSLRIERDKTRLEQHYQDAMSFLHRTEAEKKGVLIEEQELTLAVVERYRLQKYAQDAMSFLDKAFRNDSSVMVGDDDDPRVERTITEDKGDSSRTTDCETVDVAGSEPSQFNNHFVQPMRREEDKQIAADRAALARYDEEFGDFLSKAYLDDSTVIVEDAYSDTSGTDRGLFARRIAQSTTSAETGDTEYSSSAAQENRLSEDSQNEFQNTSLTDNPIIDRLRLSSPPDGLNNDGNGECLRMRLMRYEREAADYLDGTNVSVENEDCEEEPGNKYPRSQVLTGRQEYHIEDDHDDEFGADKQIDDESVPSAFYGINNSVPPSQQSLYSEPESRMPALPDGITISERKAREDACTPERHGFLVDIILKDSTDGRQEVSQVQLERSFYTQIPRGATIKLRPFVSLQDAPSTGPRADEKETERVSKSQLQRMERERDVLMATLEEIVNERSMFAAQVGEMKTMVESAGRHQIVPNAEGKRIGTHLATELKDAHDTMAKLTEEMEATLRVLDTRYEAMLERAHIAEDRCMRMESKASRMEGSYSQQGAQLSQALVEERRLPLLLSRAIQDMENASSKATVDLKKMGEGHQKESDRWAKRILDLTNTVSSLQDTVDQLSALRSSAEQEFGEERRKMQVEMEDMQMQLVEMERKLKLNERMEGKMHVNSDVQKLKRDKEVQALNRQMEYLTIKIADGDVAKRNLQMAQSKAAAISAGVGELEQLVEDLRREVKSLKRGIIAAEAEAIVVRRRYEESLSAGLSRLDQSVEMREMKAGLKHLIDEAGAREQRLRTQLAEFRVRAEQAEAAAIRAEADAREAANSAQLARERGWVAVEKERNARQAAELERGVVARECKEWEKFASQQIEGTRSMQGQSDGSSGGLAQSGSRRGLRRSSSRKELEGRKRAGRGRGMGEGGSGKRKVSLRPRFFG